jgi:RNA polymerase sigma factor (sigma-70 family)
MTQHHAAPSDPALDRRQRATDEFARHAPYLRAVAYRMLGSAVEADDAVQECWLRLDRHPPDAPDDLRPWLTTVIGRICIDLLRARRSRREDYAGSWLPEPLLGTVDSPEDTSLLADSVGLAMLVVLESLSPPERVAFVLHDVFAMPFDEVARVVDRSPAAARQLASRARRRVRSAAPDPDTDTDLSGQRSVVEAFLAAARTGDLEGLLVQLDPNVVLRTDGGGDGPLARPPVIGAPAVAQVLRARAGTFAPLGRIVIVNGGVGVLVGHPGRELAIVGFELHRGRIRAIDIVGDPIKVRHAVAAASLPTGRVAGRLEPG